MKYFFLADLNYALRWYNKQPLIKVSLVWPDWMNKYWNLKFIAIVIGLQNLFHLKMALLFVLCVVELNCCYNHLVPHPIVILAAWITLKNFVSTHKKDEKREMVVQCSQWFEFDYEYLVILIYLCTCNKLISWTK